MASGSAPRCGRNRIRSSTRSPDCSMRRISGSAGSRSICRSPTASSSRNGSCSGEGQLVEVPLVEVATAVTAEQVIRYSIDGTLLGRRGVRGVYRCAGEDAWIALDDTRDEMSPAERSAWCTTRTPEEAAKEL